MGGGEDEAFVSLIPSLWSSRMGISQDYLLLVGHILYKPTPGSSLIIKAGLSRGERPLHKNFILVDQFHSLLNQVPHTVLPSILILPINYLGPMATHSD